MSINDICIVKRSENIFESGIMIASYKVATKFSAIIQKRGIKVAIIDEC